MADLVLHVAVLGLSWIGLILFAILVSRVSEQHNAPNWLNATRSLPVPRNPGKLSGWQVGYFRDKPGARLFLCMVNYSEQGVLVRTFAYHVFLWGFFCKNRTMFVPWTACANPRVTTVPWSTSLLLRNRVELGVADQRSSILVHPDVRETWARSVNSE